MPKVDEARKELHAYLEDMEAVKPYADPGNPKHAPFLAAFEAARKKALAAATAYADAVENE